MPFQRKITKEDLEDCWADAVVGRRPWKGPRHRGLHCRYCIPDNGSFELHVDELEDDCWVDAPGRNRRFAPPTIPDKYFTFSGKVVEFHADDDNAEAQFRDIFSRVRRDEALPDAVGLPLMVGIDFEWKPDWKLSDNHPIALMQVACWDTVAVIRTTACFAMPGWMGELLEDNEVIKVTASFDVSDKDKLKMSFNWDFDARALGSSFLDIADLAFSLHLPYGMYRMSTALGTPMLKQKSVGSSNWACMGSLTEAQVQYAADDAFFTMYMFGKLLEKRAPTDGEKHVLQGLMVWKASAASMSNVLRQVDNSLYKRMFFELRNAVKDAVTVLSVKLGAGGRTTIDAIISLKPVKEMLHFAEQKKLGLKVSKSFLRQNQDLFKVQFVQHDASMADSDVCIMVSLRENDDVDNDEDVAVAPDIDDAAIDPIDAQKFLESVLEKLAKYEPPGEKKQSVKHRLIPEPDWVPSRAILNKRERSQLDAAVRVTPDAKILLDQSFSDADGIILRMRRHPRASDSIAHRRRCVEKLARTAMLDATEAGKRLDRDTKLRALCENLELIEAGSEEERHVARSLDARVRILSDAARLANRVSADWTVAWDRLERVKPYKKLLGEWLNRQSHNEESSALDRCIDDVAEVWPNIELLKALNKPSAARIQRRAV